MGPSLRLIPGIVEFIPGLNVLPGFTGAALWIALRNRDRSRSGVSDQSDGEKLLK